MVKIIWFDSRPCCDYMTVPVCVWACINTCTNVCSGLRLWKSGRPVRQRFSCEHECVCYVLWPQKEARLPIIDVKFESPSLRMVSLHAPKWLLTWCCRSKYAHRERREHIGIPFSQLRLGHYSTHIEKRRLSACVCVCWRMICQNLLCLCAGVPLLQIQEAWSQSRIPQKGNSS